MEQHNKTILVCPLDWGLGHASRMVPLIRALQRHHYRVVLAADGHPAVFLRKAFPELTLYRLPGVRVHYPRRGSLMPLYMLAYLPLMLFRGFGIRRKLNHLIRKEDIDLLISDNRYECHSSHVPSILVTHQLHPRTRGWQRLFSPLLQRLINMLVKPFDEIWIPDTDHHDGLAGALAHPPLPMATRQRYLGWLSRFNGIDLSHEDTSPYRIIVLLSGPEPQRTMLEERLMLQALHLSESILFLQGKPGDPTDIRKGNVHLLSHATDQEIARWIAGAELVISRPGYSTLMDLMAMGSKAAFIPTPGQTEQLYLTKRIKTLGWAWSSSQKAFTISEAWSNRHEYSGLPGSTTHEHLLTEAIMALPALMNPAKSHADAS